ncbi:hypothetical protein BN3658_00688 [Coriobacteriaceae bacterium CHKCI002]|nr:hypothetical protein BN3658_00688 [Coriobacteriaceae bacterium CHKCI002]
MFHVKHPGAQKRPLPPASVTVGSAPVARVPTFCTRRFGRAAETNECFT